jgi:hypothetical protein
MTNETKQTAIEWLLNEWPILKSELPHWLIEQAKEMEKNQIINAHEQGQSDEKDYWNIGDKVGVRFAIKSEQFYNETYGGNK